jgi:hypothetical protein
MHACNNLNTSIQTQGIPMTDTISRFCESQHRKTTLGYVVILAFGLVMVNVTAWTYGSDVTEAYSATVVSSR